MISLNYVYFTELAALFISMICIIMSALHQSNEGQKLTEIVAFLVFLICLGCLGTNLKPNLDLMVYANKIEYLGACNIYAVFALLYAKVSNIRIPKWLKIIMFSTGGILTFFTSTIDLNHFYYRSYHIEMIGSVPKLMKVYAPMHTVFIAVTGIYLCTYMAMYLYRRITSHTFKDRYPLVLGLAAAMPILAFILEKFAGTKMILLPFGLILCDMQLFYLIRHHFFDVNSIALDRVFENAEDAIIIENAYHEYEGSNKLAQQMFPSLWYLNIGDSIDKKTPYSGYGIRNLAGNKENRDPYCFQGHQYKLSSREIRTKNGKGLIGNILTLKDVTAEMEHERLLESYRAELENSVEQKTAQLKMVQEQMIFGFASLVENKNIVTGGHIKRTSAYVNVIGKQLLREKKFQLELNERYVARLRLIAPLHDVGKISVPESILDKPGKLTKEEFEIIKTHTTNGARIVEMIMGTGSDRGDCSMAEEVALYHHEKWDGTGYPTGKRESEIPLSARIMAVADVFDALTSERPYKKAFSIEKAVGILMEERGTHFDPTILDAFLRVLPEVKRIYLNNESEGFIRQDPEAAACRSAG